MRLSHVLHTLVLLSGSLCWGLRPRMSNDGTSRQKQLATIRCKVTGNNAWHFSQYVASDWENEWVTNKDQWNGKICATMLTQQVNSQQWLDDVAALHNDYQELDTWGFQHLKPSIWSFIEYVNPCLPSSDPKRVLRVPIEPLVGLMRHPFTPTPCVPPGKEMANPESRDYLLVNAMPPRVRQQLYPGRAWLFDLGTQAYKTSIGWFVDRYGAQGVNFEGIFAWEAAGIDHSNYWTDVPAKVVPALRLYNHPVQADLLQPGQPLNILYQVYRPGDLVIFKLDIDHPELEHTVLKAVTEPDVRRMIGEMYFEHHSDAREMAVFGLGWGEDMTPWPTSISLFHELRKEGMRIHYWP